jgi:hypothetical protein
MLDAEQRLVAGSFNWHTYTDHVQAKIIKRFIRDFKKTAFIVEHGKKTVRVSERKRFHYGNISC